MRQKKKRKKICFGAGDIFGAEVSMDFRIGLYRLFVAIFKSVVYTSVFWSRVCVSGGGGGALLIKYISQRVGIIQHISSTTLVIQS